MTIPREHEYILANAIKEWLAWECDMREKVRRPYAVINGFVLPLEDVVFHEPDGMR